jgi:aminoglycoside 6'-N-acetyltransferase I
MSIEIRLLRRGDEPQLGRVAPGVFDDPIDAAASTEFLADERHHLAVAIDGGFVVGFVSALRYVHPDKACPELWINEVGVAPTHRRRGVGKAMLSALLAMAREARCSEAWVLTDRSNPAAMRLYASLGGTEAPQDAVMYTFRLGSDAGTQG